MQILIQLFHILVFPGLLFDVAMGVLLMGLNNKLVARMQNRVGPPILQPWYDFLKCCGKETIVPARAKRAVFLGAPFLGFVLLISVSMFIPFAGSPHVCECLRDSRGGFLRFAVRRRRPVA